MNILITGSTGYLGKALVKKLLEHKHHLFLLVRNIKKAEKLFGDQCQYISWKNYNDRPDLSSIEQLDAVINLMGENIAQTRWSNQRKKDLYNSRIESTRNLLAALRTSSLSPHCLVSTSATGYYGDRPGEIVKEDSTSGEGFLAKICKDWEEKALEGTDLFKRIVILRVSMVLGPQSHAIAKMLPVFKMGLGGKLGDGSQMMPWIHLVDLVRLYQMAVEKEDFKGIYNACSPYQTTNREFTNTLVAILHRPAFLNVPRFVLDKVLGEMNSVLMQDVNVDVSKLKGTRFHYIYPTLELAIKTSLGNQI